MSQAFPFGVALALCLWAPGVTAGSGLRLGVGLGVSLPEGLDWVEFEIRDWEPGLVGGLFVDIPVAWSFHLSPMVTVYKIGGRHATDLDLGLKLVFPVWPAADLDLTLGVAPGLTTLGSTTAGNLHGLVGASVGLFWSVHAFVLYSYGIVFDATRSFQVMHAQAGLLLRL
jgi:hypothetical protein